ncbi:Hypp7331 [Branchiostoma lanceolatum]|uniref:Hypp7331 protein n=1 Tax=Branchiostoma lanceolatum TaxID=7740 RepID=A0A8J9YZQ2_BRALA|nr:Hypp7331 [Branchiostoma lanceolatum]
MSWETLGVYRLLSSIPLFVIIVNLQYEAHVRTRPGLEARERRGGNLKAGTGAAVQLAPVRRAHVRTRPGLEARERRGGNLIAGGAAVRRGRAARARAASTCANAAGTGSARAAGRKSDSGHGRGRAARPCSSAQILGMW